MKILKHYIIYYIIFIFSIIIYSLTINGGLYLPLIYFMYASPFLLLTLCPKNFRNEELYFWVIIPLMFSSYLTHPESFRLSTVIYSSLFILVFIIYRRLLYQNSILILQYRNILLLIIYAYFLVLVLQQLGVLLHLPVVNQNWTFETLKLNSLAYEASYVATLLPLLMLSIVKVDEIIFDQNFEMQSHFKKNIKLWVAFLYTIFTCGATTVFFTFPLFILYFFRKKISVMSLLGIILLVVIGFLAILYFNPEIIERQLKLIPAILSFDSNTIIETDISSSTRIVPFLLLFERVKNLDFNLFWGYGIDYGQRLYGETITGDADRVVGSPGIVSYILDYGLITGVIFIHSVLKYTSKKMLSYENLFFISCFLIFGFNHYLTWIYIILMSTNIYFFQQSKNLKTRSLK